MVFFYNFFFFIFCFPGNFIANDKPLLVRFNNDYYFPIISSYPETIYGGDFETETDYRDPYVQNLINEKGWIVWPIIPYSYNTIIRDLEVPAPAPPSMYSNAKFGRTWRARERRSRAVGNRRFSASRSAISSALRVAAGSTVVDETDIYVTFFAIAGRVVAPILPKLSFGRRMKCTCPSDWTVPQANWIVVVRIGFGPILRR